MTDSASQHVFRSPGNAYIEGLTNGHWEALSFIWGRAITDEKNRALLMDLHEEMREWFKAVTPPYCDQAG